MRGDVFRARPEVVAALSELSGRFDVARMRRLNERIEVDGDSVARVAASALSDLGLVAPTAAIPTLASGRASSFLSYLVAQRSALLGMTARHLFLVIVSLACAVLVAIPLGVALERSRLADAVVGALGVLQTIPGIALLAFMLPLIGIGVVPALVALFVYSLYPIARNTLTGVRGADHAAVEAAIALGMTPWQVLRWVRMPLATPVIMAGVRTAAVLNVGTATLAAFIGAGGLGDPIVAGLALADSRMVLSGALPAAALALLVDGGLAVVQRVAVRASGSEVRQARNGEER